MASESEHAVHTCRLYCDQIDDAAAEDGTSVARGHPGSEDYNTFDDVPLAYGVVTGVDTLSAEDEAEYGALWVSGACVGGTENAIVAEIDLSTAASGVLSALASAFGGAASALTGALIGGGGGGGSGAISGAVSGSLW